MKASNLMIGDWVNLYNSPIKINIDDLGVIERDETYDKGVHCEPIPLTEEILVKNGFMRTDFLDYGGARIGISLLYKDRSDGEEGFRVLIENRSPKIETRTTIKPVKYVHEIQHTLRDLEIDKEIIL